MNEEAKHPLKTPPIEKISHPRFLPIPYLRLNFISMKKIFLGAAALLLVGLTSCEKCSECACTGFWSYEFDPEISAENETVIRNIYDDEFSTDYADRTEEVCAKGQKNLDEAVANYKESEELDFSDASTIQGGLPWSVSGVYECICTEL